MGEFVHFVRPQDSRDVELLCVHQSQRTWTILNTGLCFALSLDWQGRLGNGYRGVPLGPGEILCTEPGDVLCLAPVEERAGSFRLLDVLLEAFHPLYESESDGNPMRVPRSVTPRDSAIGRAVRQVLGAMLRTSTRLELQTHLVFLARACADEWRPERASRRVSLPPLGTLARLRDLLHGDTSPVNLGIFAQQAGVSQYQLLRGFKRKYGVAPHTYETHLRVERARSMLRQGHTVARAAEAQHFVDSSHLTRHFRRIWGVTPGQYARTWVPCLPDCDEEHDDDALVLR